MNKPLLSAREASNLIGCSISTLDKYEQERLLVPIMRVDAKLFDISERQVERHMNKVFTKMGLPLRQYGTHSARKLFATKVYVENDYNIELVRVLLQHSSVVTTQRYIGIQQKQVEDALAGTVVNLV